MPRSSGTGAARVERLPADARPHRRRQRVVVEADGRDPHLAPLTFAFDRRRDRRLRVEGWEPVRVTTVDLGDRPDELDADLRALLRLGPHR